MFDMKVFKDFAEYIHGKKCERCLNGDLLITANIIKVRQQNNDGIEFNAILNHEVTYCEPCDHMVDTLVQMDYFPEAEPKNKLVIRELEQ